MILKQYNSKFITYKNPAGVYTFKDLSEVLSRGFKNEFEVRGLQPYHKHDRSDSIVIEIDNITLIIKLILRYQINILMFDNKCFLKVLPVFDHIGKLNVVIMNIIVIKRNLSTIYKIHLKCDVIDGSIVNGL